jgi:DNA-binding Lrp family transcriptional regulator
MVSAVVLLSVDHDQIGEVAEAVTEMDGVSAVYSVAGRYDLVAVVRVKTNEDLADLIPGRILKNPRIKSAETLIAFRVYSRKDVDAAFSLGGETG